MRSGLNLDNPVLAAAFRSALLHQGIVALLVFGILALTWVTIREWRPARAGSAGGAGSVRGMGLHTGMYAEPSWRTLLRVGFGLLWIFDGLLQAQPSMVVGLPSQVIQPTAASSPAWVQHLVNWAGTSWSYHPVQAAAAAVWIQAGIGCWLLSARHGRWSRLAGLAGLAWGLTVWVFGESFGGIFAPGLTWLFGAPGAALFYCAAGVLIALPVRYWRAPWLGRALLAVLGLFFTGMAVLQAWPGRGFWQGRLGHGPGTLTGMIQSMAQTPQPAFLAGWVGGFGSFTAAHGFAVNMFAVAALALIGTALLIGAALPGGALPAGSVSSLRPGTPHGGTAQAGGQLLRQRGDDRALRRGPGSRALLGRRLPLIRLAVIAAVLLCLADWVLIEDMGIFGGLGTDPNSMIPIALVPVAGYLAVAPAPARATATEAAMAVRADASVAVRAERALKRAAQVLAGAGAGANGAREAGAPELTGARAGANAAQEAGVPKLARAGAAADMIAGMAAAGTAAPAAKEQSGPEPATPQPAGPAPASRERATPQPTSPAPAGQGPATPHSAGPAPAGRGSAGTAPAAQEPAGRDPAAPEKPTVRVPARRKAWQAEGWRGRLSPARLAAAFGGADARTLAATWALGVTILGAFPLAAAAANRSADPVIAEAIDGSAVTLNFPAPGFRLTDQNGKPVSLAGLRGKVVLLTFLDPVCTSDCPLIAQEFRAADQLLGANRRGVVLVAVAANPVYHTKAYARAFDQQEGLAHLPNWKFLSGPLPALKRVWHDYYFSAQIVPAGGMLLHSDVAYVIDAAGRTRTELNFNPGPGTSASKSSFAAELSAAAVRAMRSS